MLWIIWANFPVNEVKLPNKVWWNYIILQVADNATQSKKQKQKQKQNKTIEDKILSCPSCVKIGGRGTFFFIIKHP